MKVLSVFIDMLGADYIHTLNPNIAETSFDKLLKQMGGTIYSNCYTPTPDTPRSSDASLTVILSPFILTPLFELHP